jgi:type IV pilus assembly protein PilV
MKAIHTNLRGFSLVEALIALLALSVGLLGIAGLQLTGLRSNQSSAWRSQATYLAYDILDRIRANRGINAAQRANYNAALGAAPAVGGLPQADLTAWKAALTATLPGGDGTVALAGVDNTRVTVTVQWDDTRGVGAPLVFTLGARL